MSGSFSQNISGLIDGFEPFSGLGEQARIITGQPVRMPDKR
jgi:hypothetical protein